MRKIRYIIKSLAISTIVFIDYDIVLNITKQTSLTILSTDKINLRLVRVLDYL